MKNKKLKIILFPIVVAVFFSTIISCNYASSYLSLDYSTRKEFNKLYNNLQNETLYEKKFIIVRDIISILSGKASNGDINLFLTTYVEQNKQDPFGAYYLLAVARNYRDDQAYPFAINYYERILKNHKDLSYMGNSIHYLCLRELLEMIEDDEARVTYYKDIITRFSDFIDIGETYYYLGNTYAEVGEWDQAIQAYRNFLDLSVSSIDEDSFARERVSELLAYYNTEKTWTFESLDTLVSRVSRAINSAKFSRDSRLLREHMAKVNFFAVSWEEEAPTTDPEFIRNLGTFLSPRISLNRSLDLSSNQQEAYLKTNGWSYRISTWYLYFRRINFPADSTIHGNWEWTGIYFGEKTFAAAEDR